MILVRTASNNWTRDPFSRLILLAIMTAFCLVAFSCKCDCQWRKNRHVSSIRLRGNGAILVLNAAAMEEMFGSNWEGKHIFYRTIGYHGGAPYRETYYESDMKPIPQGSTPILSLAESAVSSKGMIQLFGFYCLEDKVYVQVKFKDPNFALEVLSKKTMERRTDSILPSGYLKW